MTKQKVIRRFSTNRDLFVRSSFSWYHSNLGAGTAVNWQWNMASSFLSTTTSSGETTGRGKLLSARGKKRRTNIGAVTRANHQTIKSHICGCSTVTKGATASFIKTCQSQRKAVKKRELSQLWVLTAWTAWKIAEWLLVINLRLKVHHHTFRT